MRRFLIALISFFVCTAGWAASHIKMVTYFPVPYMSYPNLNVSKTCDVGFVSKCELTATDELKVDTVNLKSGALSLEIIGDPLSAELVTSGQLEEGSANGVGELHFQHELTVNQVSHEMQSMEAKTATLENLKFGNAEFPTCNNDYDHEIKWRKLTIGGKEGMFLVCEYEDLSDDGDDEEPSPSKRCSSWEGGPEYCAARFREFMPGRIYDPSYPDGCCQQCTGGTIWDSEHKRCATLQKTFVMEKALRIISASTGQAGDIFVGNYTLKNNTVSSSGSAYGGYGYGYGGGSSASGSCMGFTYSSSGNSGLVKCTSSFCTSGNDVGKKCYNDTWYTITSRTTVSTKVLNDPSGQSCTCHNGSGTLSCSYNNSLYSGGGAPASAICSELPEGSSYAWHSGGYLCECNTGFAFCNVGSMGYDEQDVYWTRGLESASVYKCELN